MLIYSWVRFEFGCQEEREVIMGAKTQKSLGDEKEGEREGGRDGIR